MPTMITNIEIDQFVSKVKNELRHLSAEDRAELTDNLSVDLLDQLEEQGHTFTLPNPKEYAFELASAAGLAMGDQEVSRMNLEFLRIWRNLLGYFRTLAPAWAIVRAWLAFSLIYSPIVYGMIREVPNDASSILVLVGLVVASVWLSLKQFRPMKYVLITLNALLLIGSPVVIADINQAIHTYSNYVILDQTSALSFQGHAVNGVCAVDEYGNKVRAVKLLDSTGYEIYRADDVLGVCQ